MMRGNTFTIYAGIKSSHWTLNILQFYLSIISHKAEKKIAFQKLKKTEMKK